MDAALLALLARHHGYDRRARTRLGALSDAERARLAAAGLVPDVETAIGHDEAVLRLHAAAARLDEDDVTSAFLAGLTPEYARGRQPILSYAFARGLPEHEARPNSNGICLACGLPLTDTVEVAHEIVRLHLGWAWNEMPLRYLVDLESFDPQTIPAASVERGRATLAALLALAAEQPAEQTPGKLEREIARARLLPHEPDRYKRLGILIALAETGLLPNPLLPPLWRAFSSPPEIWAASRRVKGSARSDITLPLAAWRGAQGVDWGAAEELFGVRPPTR